MHRERERESEKKKKTQVCTFIHEYTVAQVEVECSSYMDDTVNGSWR